MIHSVFSYPIILSYQIIVKMANKNCDICCEKYNKSTHAKVKCQFGDCEYQACKSCIRTYLL